MTNSPGDGEPPTEPTVPPTPPGPQPYPPGYPQHYPPGYPQPAPPGWYPGPSGWQLPDHPSATKALVLGIISLVGGFACYLPLLVGPWAWAVGRRAVQEIDAQPGRYGGRGQALAGYVLGVVATVLLVLGVIALVLVLGFFAFSGTSEPGPVVPGQSM